jgi:hypothetical protein
MELEYLWLFSIPIVLLIVWIVWFVKTLNAGGD